MNSPTYHPHRRDHGYYDSWQTLRRRRSLPARVRRAWRRVEQRAAWLAFAALVTLAGAAWAAWITGG